MIPLDRSERARLLLLLALVTSAAAAFWPALAKLLMRWDTGDNNYCYLIVPLCAYLLWEQRPTFRFFDFAWTPWGLVPLALGLAFAVIGEYGSIETLVQTGIWACAVAILTTLYGRRICLLAFPLLILLFIVPLPPFINQALTFKLKMAASSLAVDMLRASGVSVFLEGNLIDLGVQKLQVVDACSGLRYFMPMILMALLVGYFFAPGRWRVMVLLFLVVPLSVIVNAIRIWLTGVLTAWGHEKLAQSLFHDFSGWLMFMIAGALLVAAAHVLKRFGSPPTKTPIAPAPSLAPAALPPSGQPVDAGSSGVGRMQPLVVTACFCVLFLAAGWVLERNKENYTIPPRKAFSDFPMTIGPWQGTRSYISKEILESLWADDYVTAAFSRPDSRNQIYLLVPYYEYQETQHTAHAPQACLLGGGYAMKDTAKRSVPLTGGGNLDIMTMVLTKGDVTMLGSYFFLQRGRIITNPYLNKFYLMVDSFRLHRTDGALVRVEVLIPAGGSLEGAYKELDTFLASLWQILPQYVPQ